jgi:hypothetical protein
MRRAFRLSGAVFVAALGAAWMSLLPAGAAPAASTDTTYAAVRFEIGAFNTTAGDWQVSAVQLSGGLREGEHVAVTFEAANGVTLWQGESDFAAPITRITVDRFIGVASLARVTLAQQSTGILAARVLVSADGRTPVPLSQSSDGSDGGYALGLPVSPPEASAEIVIRSPSSSSSLVSAVAARGSATAPRLAVSLVVLLVIFAIVFRLPLMPFGSQARWRR